MYKLYPFETCLVDLYNIYVVDNVRVRNLLPRAEHFINNCPRETNH